MPTVAESIDVKAPLIQWLGALGMFYTKDLLALPESSLFVSPGGACKSAQVITGEVIGLCNFATHVLRGEETPSSEGAPDMSSCDTAAKLVQALGVSITALSAAIGDAPDDIWAKEIMPPWGMPGTVWDITNIAVNHIWYHDGQLNSYQALLGDDKVHWMD
jgi:hypothetical protein